MLAGFKQSKLSNVLKKHSYIIDAYSITTDAYIISSIFWFGRRAKMKISVNLSLETDT